jgi:hypothetical protein
MHNGQPENCSDPVACDRRDRAAVALDGGLNHGEDATGDVPQRLGIEVFAPRRVDRQPHEDC